MNPWDFRKYQELSAVDFVFALTKLFHYGAF